THTQARYVLPIPVARLRDAYPKVNISLHQATPQEVARMVIDEVADIGMATESLADYPELVTLPCYEWQHVLVLPGDHPLAHKERIGLDDLAVVARPHGLGHGVQQSGVAGKVRKALAQVDGVVLGGQGRHDGEDGGAHLRQFVRQGRCAGGRAGLGGFSHGAWRRGSQSS
ncbi:hypothetical protein ET532_011095, partial [Verminephrobacter sp. Larva24]